MIPNPDQYPDISVALAVAGTATEHVRLGTSVTEAFRRHPAMLAQTFAYLHHLFDGRMILGIGAGEKENVEPYGIAFEKPASRVEEAIRIIRLLWNADGPVDFEGQFWQLRDSVLGIGPTARSVQVDRHGRPVGLPSIWLAANRERMLRVVGELCDGWLPINPGGVDAWTSALKVIEGAAGTAGRSISEIEAGLWTYLVIDEDGASADRLLESAFLKALLLCLPESAFEELGTSHPLGEHHYGLLEYVPSRLGREEAIKAMLSVPTELCRRFMLCGTPDDVVKQARAFEAAGVQHLVMCNVTGLADPALAKTSRHLEREVASELKK